MRNIESTILLLVLGASRALGVPAGGWSTNYDSVLEEAKGNQQPVLVYFTASWCGPCKLMARTTLTNEAVLQTLSGLPHVALDVDEHSKLAEQHGVRAVPTFQMLSPDGDMVATTTGYQEANHFISWLTNSVSETKEAVARQKQFARKLAAADESLRDASPESLRKAAAELIDLCAERDGALQKSVHDRLQALAASDPALVLNGLNHPRLAVRIHVANLLRAQLGDAFDVDPWSDAATRQKAVALWRAKLAGQKSTGERSP
jgi:thioredoxin-like negative regulator of GroEL